MTDISEGLLIAATGIITVFGTLAVLCGVTFFALFLRQMWVNQKESGGPTANLLDTQTMDTLNSELEMAVEAAVRTSMQMDLDEPRQLEHSGPIAWVHSQVSSWIVNGRIRQFGSQLWPRGIHSSRL